MASWYKLQIGNYKTRINKIAKARQDFRNCDDEGNELTIEYNKGTKKFFNQKGEEVFKDDVYKLVNGKPRRKLKRTNFIEFKEENFVSPTTAKNLLIEAYYFVDCPMFLDLLKEKKKIYKVDFFSNGNGMKFYEGYIIPYKNWCIMVLGFGRIDEEIKELLGNYTSLTEKENALGNSVERASEEELIDIYVQELQEREQEIKV